MKINEILQKALWDRFYNHVKIAADLLCNRINQKLKTAFAASTSDLQPVLELNFPFRL